MNMFQSTYLSRYRRYDFYESLSPSVISIYLRLCKPKAFNLINHVFWWTLFLCSNLRDHLSCLISYLKIWCLVEPKAVIATSSYLCISFPLIKSVSVIPYFLLEPYSLLANFDLNYHRRLYLGKTYCFSSMWNYVC